MTFKYFTRQEFDCQETGENEMEDEFIHALDALRHQCRIPRLHLIQFHTMPSGGN